MKRILPCLLWSTALILFIASCTHKSSDIQPISPGTGTGGGGNNNSGSGGTGSGTGADTALCFERDVLPIFISNCAKSGCHDAASAKDGYVFTSYQTITAKKFRPGSPWDTELFEKITETDPGDIMPPPPQAPLTQEQVGRIYRWIAMGAPNTTGCSNGCDSSKFTFSSTVQPILAASCRGCHSTASPTKGVNLETYAGVKAVANDGRLLAVIKHLPGYVAMPQGGNKLSDCQIMQIEKWVNAGAPNN